ncbi:hypothetical protein [Chryseobacterium culicis]|uniref:Molybdopterin-binding protein n=1 Tax=Chryseobacterium culicis TaxID=680127 RepID=A0A1H6IMI0_CHRCI|nr:hypothetical protein [Chryseobacterium culicis]SEH47724.1 hypothetical protein SAMN05421593_4514 [Chryseobacterium culicis]
MKNLAVIMFIFSSILSFGQSFEIINPDNEKKVMTLDDLKAFQKHNIKSLKITNHLKEYKSTLENANGVLLRDVLSKVAFKEKSPKVLSEYYIVCIAEDNYKVVFSWNEIFNTAVGDTALIITDAKDRPNDGISTLSPTDFATGRRYVKNLKTIQLKKVD